ncbi:MAG: hypothetical protein HC927_03215 [Deltaproteobacteria bacterium]|nr:hypothetical protein [Deltaproteobacteria bacterium]
MYHRELPETKINGKTVRGSVGVLRKGARKFAGFSFYRNKRMIRGFKDAWKPSRIFGGVDDEGANNLVAQRLTGILELDDFEVSHTKDAILFSDNEEEELEKWLAKEVQDYRDYAARRRGGSGGRTGLPWSRDKVRQLLEDMKEEFANDEMRDRLNTAILPPLNTILANNARQVQALSGEDLIAEIDILPDLTVKVSLEERSSHEHYVTIAAGAEPGTIHVIINNLHEYYQTLEPGGQYDECIRQFLYDAVAEYRVSKLKGKLWPATVRRMKDELLRVAAHRAENAAAAQQDEDSATTDDDDI